MIGKCCAATVPRVWPRTSGLCVVFNWSSFFGPVRPSVSPVHLYADLMNIHLYVNIDWQLKCVKINTVWTALVSNVRCRGCEGGVCWLATLQRLWCRTMFVNLSRRKQEVFSFSFCQGMLNNTRTFLIWIWFELFTYYIGCVNVLRVNLMSCHSSIAYWKLAWKSDHPRVFVRKIVNATFEIKLIDQVAGTYS